MTLQKKSRLQMRRDKYIFRRDYFKGAAKPIE